MWLLYLDDIFCKWTQGSQNLNELFNCINSPHPTIKFTMDYSTTEINFLAVTVTKVCNKLETYTANQTIRTSTFTHNHATVMCVKYLLHGDSL